MRWWIRRKGWHTVLKEGCKGGRGVQGDQVGSGVTRRERTKVEGDKDEAGGRRVLQRYLSCRVKCSGRVAVRLGGCGRDDERKRKRKRKRVSRIPSAAFGQHFRRHCDVSCHWPAVPSLRSHKSHCARVLIGVACTTVHVRVAARHYEPRHPVWPFAKVWRAPFSALQYVALTSRSALHVTPSTGSFPPSRTRCAKYCAPRRSRLLSSLRRIRSLHILYMYSSRYALPQQPNAANIYSALCSPHRLLLNVTSLPIHVSLPFSLKSSPRVQFTLRATPIYRTSQPFALMYHILVSPSLSCRIISVPTSA